MKPMQPMLCLSVFTGIVVFGCAPTLSVNEPDGEGGSGGSAEISSSSSGSSNSSSGSMAGLGCNDGIDNDNDGIVDCADVEECGSAIFCGAPVPAGWEPVHLSQDSFGGKPLPCADGSLPTSLYSGPSPTTCSPCSCSLSGSCKALMECYDTLMCSGGSAVLNFNGSSSCQLFNVTGTKKSCAITSDGTVPLDTMCSVSPSMLADPAPWQIEAQVCLAMAKESTCSSGTCLQQPPEGFESKPCIQSPGSLDCPVNFPVKHQFFSQFADTRSCSPCACDVSQAVCIGSTTVSLSSDAACGTDTAMVTKNSGCVNAPNGTNFAHETQSTKLTLLPGGCEGGVGTGTVAGGDPVTICCEL